MSRDVGALGESTLLGWAANRDICAQKVTVDRTGWDCLLELPPKQEGESLVLPKDRLPARISCLVQVKATSTGRLSPSIKLANWQRLVTSTLPAFVLVLDYDKSEVPRAAYLVPVGVAWIERVLRRIRELDARSEEIAGHSMRVICGAEDKLDIPNGESLERAIRAHVGESMEEYVERKIQWVRTAGYEMGRGVANFEVSVDALAGLSPAEALVDLSLGLREPLAISRAQLWDVRFGIRSGAPVSELPSGTIEFIQGPPEKVQVSLALGTSVARATADMFLPHGLGKVLEPSNLKCRLKGRFFDLVLSAGGGAARFSFEGAEEEAPLRDLHECAGIALLMGEAARVGEGVRFGVILAGRVLFRTTINVASEAIPDEIMGLVNAVQSAWIVAKHLDIQDDVRLDMGQLLIQAERLKVFRDMLAVEAGRVRIGGFLDKSSRLGGKRVCIPLGIAAIMGDYKASAVVSMWGKLKLTGREREGQIEFSFISAERRVERMFATRKGEEGCVSLNEAVAAVAESYSAVPCLLLEQYAS